MKKFFFWVFPPILLITFTLIALEALVQRGVIPSFLFPAPSQIAVAFIEFREELTKAFAGTSEATLSGLLLSLVVAQALALALSLSSFMRRALFPFAVFFQTVPIIAIAPLLVIWFGFGAPTVRASAAIVAFFPILSNAMVGLESSRREFLELFQVLGASRWQTLLKLQIPSSFRSSFAGLRIAAGLAVVGALVGEFVGGGGLGSLIDSARTQQRVDVVFACVILSALLGLVFVGVVLLLEFLIQKWRPFNES